MVAVYTPLKITGNKTGLVQEREEFLLPNDAYPILENAFVWRERIKRKQGLELLGRLRRVLAAQSLGEIQASVWNFNIFTALNQTGTITNATQANPCEITSSANHFLQTGQFVTITGVTGMTELNGNTYQITVTGATTFTLDGVDSTGFGAYIAGGTWETNNTSSESNKEIEPGSVFIVLATLATAFIDQGNGILTNATPGNSGTINYVTGDISLTHTAVPGNAAAISMNYFPGLPVMGLRSRELNNINSEQMIAFDQVYAYRYGATGFEEFIPGTTWTGTNSDFFWSTNYWVGDGNQKIFWVTNDSGTSGDPIRYTNGTAWVDFAPIIDAAGNRLQQCLAMLPFRGRLVTFNTLEGMTLAGSVRFFQRIRWSAIGNPFSEISSIVSVINADAWRDDIRGQGGFLDIPTSESIVAVGFVRDNLVIYCERSTWQLRYTGRSIAPFQIEKVNSELGAESTFSAVQFDTSLVGIGDKGVVECDSFKSNRIDIKIPDLVFYFNNDNDGPKRVHGIRDLQQRLAYWTYPYKPDEKPGAFFPNRRLVYNYENDSWAIFTDSLTCFGTYQPQNSLRWQDCNFPWSQANFPWISRPSLFPALVGGNQQGFVQYLGSNVTPKVSNGISLSITDVAGFGTTNNDPPVQITSPNHNLDTGAIIKITDIPTGTPFSSELNDKIFSVIRVSADVLQLMVFDPSTQQFNLPQLADPDTYIGGGKISVRDNFRIFSKKFNFLDEGENIQLGFIDILMDNTDEGAISLNVYIDYDENEPVNTLPANVIPSTLQPDTFFNSVVPTNAVIPRGSSKNWQRVFCAARAAFLTIEWTLSNAQMIGIEQESEVQIDAQILWIRKAGKQLPVGV